MKKIQMMMLMMLTAFMGFALQSCGSDDDNKSEATDTYTMSLEIVNKGDLSDDEAEFVNGLIQEGIKEAMSKSGATTTVTATETQAKVALDLIITASKSDLENAFKGTGNTKKFTLAFILRNSSKKVVYQRNVQVDGEKITVQ